MPIPFTALIPFGFIVAMYGVTGASLDFVSKYKNEGKPPRYALDIWDKKMMERDRCLTGTMRGQSTNPIAPPEFSRNSAWYLRSQ
ncbi:hypothetical protein G9A89_021485 [Geosiphon pyriformis]|nr:hypothetical protein G9A89_021485 [Geosiphon pyriformis]